MQKSNFTVIYDTNALYPQCLRDILIRLAQKDLFRAKWTEDILIELKRNLIEAAKERAGKTGLPQTLTQEKVEQLTQMMNEAVRDSLVIGYHDIEKGLSLPDPKDKHVLAAAIKAKADVIVTWNLKDFPREILAQYDIEAQTPDFFVGHIFDLDEEAVIRAVREQRESLKRPPYTPLEMLASYSRNKLHALVENLKGHEHRLKNSKTHPSENALYALRLFLFRGGSKAPP